MRKQLVALVGLGLLLATSSAYSQTLRPVKANIPFPFVVEKTLLPAGQYVVTSAGLFGGAITIQSLDGKVSKMVLPNACQSDKVADVTKLVFHRYGDHYFLAQIWRAGNDIGKEMPTSPRETELAMSSPGQSVVVVATLR